MKKLMIGVLVLLHYSMAAIAQQVPVPKNYSIVDTVSGDLDKDGIPELVVAYNTQQEDEETRESVPRELVIYKRQGLQWKAWVRSGQALPGSRDGGMMGDPYEEMNIQSGILSISHSGGSNWKWGHTDKYRYQNGEFFLIGYSAIAGKLCEYWEDVDFNLSTGRMSVKKEYERCGRGKQEVYKKENEVLYKKGLKITLQNRNAKEIKIVTPKYRHEIYIAVKDEE